MGDRSTNLEVGWFSKQLQAIAKEGPVLRRQLIQQPQESAERITLADQLGLVCRIREIGEAQQVVSRYAVKAGNGDQRVQIRLIAACLIGRGGRDGAVQGGSKFFLAEAALGTELFPECLKKSR